MSISSNKTPRAVYAPSVSSSIKSPLKSRQERQTNFKVVIRVRPPLPRELSGDIPFQNIVNVDDREQCITVSENIEAVMDEDGQVLAAPGPYTTHSFLFDYVYEQHSTQKKVYDTTARPVVDSALTGYNATIFAYGQTGTGKTFTMEGFNPSNREGAIEARGIIPRAIEQIFGHIQRNASPRLRFLVRASYLQIYNEQISDLLKPERSNLTIREDKRRGVYVEGLSEWVVRSPAEIYGLMQRGGAIRATGETKMNEMSSRSHAVFIVIVEQSETVYVDDEGSELSVEQFHKFMQLKMGVKKEQDMKGMESHVRQSFKVGKLNLVDLAGSERVRLSGATGQRLEESKQINRSLAALGNVISALTEAKSRQHIPYRDSRLTRMLEDSLGGNCKTTMMAMVSPAFEAMQETISTLKFANRAKNIKNEAKVNEDLDQKSLLRKYERELKKLRAELEERSKNVVDKRRLLELDEQRRRAEADKMAAIRALEQRSLEFMHEKEEKKKLEQRIAMLMGQMLRGDKAQSGSDGQGRNVNNTVDPDQALLIKEQQEKLSKEYKFKLADLERERETIEEEKAQVDRYKQLLLKQRDIMIALTQRLVERDEQIMALQDELDAYDSHHKELEEKLDEKTAMLIKFQRIAMEENASSPFKNEELSEALETSWTHKDNGGSSGATEVVNDIDDDLMSVASKSIIDNQRAKIAELEQLLLENRNESSLRNSSADSSFDQGSNILLQKLMDENNKLKSRNNELEIEYSKAMNSGSDLDSGYLQSKCNTLLKERDAVSTIMESKIKVLVQSVAQSAGAVVSSNPAIGKSQAGAALTKDLTALMRLVNASIAALRNAANSSGTSSSASQSSSENTSPNMSYTPGSSFSGETKPFSSEDSVTKSVTFNPGRSTGSSNWSADSGTTAAGNALSKPHQNQTVSSSSSSWGEKDSFYSSGDVFRRA